MVYRHLVPLHYQCPNRYQDATSNIEPIRLVQTYFHKRANLHLM